MANNSDQLVGTVGSRPSRGVDTHVGVGDEWRLGRVGIDRPEVAVTSIALTLERNVQIAAHLDYE